MLNDAKKLSGRLREDDSNADNVITTAQEVLKEVEAMKQYQEDIDNLNAIAHNRPRAQLVLGIQQENRHIRQLQHENKELRAALEESQNAIELIMSKYRQQISSLVASSKLDKNVMNQKTSKVLQDRADKICEMAAIMNASIRVDEENEVKVKELMSRLVTENKGLRELLEISHRNGSYAEPLVGPRMVSKQCQTETDQPSPTPLAPRSPVSGPPPIVMTNAVSPIPPIALDDVTTSSISSESEDDEIRFDTIKRTAGKDEESDKTDEGEEQKS